MKWVLVALALGTFVLYANAISSFFSRSHGVDRRMKLLQGAGTVSALVHLFTLYSGAPSSLWSFLAAALMYLAALLVFVMAKRAVGVGTLTLAFSGDDPVQIVRSGIYSVVRHPFYSAYLMTWTAGVIAAPTVWTVGTTVVMGSFYFTAAKYEEKKFLNSSLAHDYRLYMRGAGLMWPKLYRVGDE